jgi:hypothetical protein
LNQDLTPRALAEVRQAKGNPLIQTEDFTAEDVKEIAADAMVRYKKIAIINSLKNPGKTLGTLVREPHIAAKFVKNMLS